MSWLQRRPWLRGRRVEYVSLIFGGLLPRARSSFLSSTAGSTWSTYTFNLSGLVDMGPWFYCLAFALEGRIGLNIWVVSFIDLWIYYVYAFLWIKNQFTANFSACVIGFLPQAAMSWLLEHSGPSQSQARSTMFFRDVFTKYSCDSARVPASVQHCKWCSSRVPIRFKHMVTSPCSLPLHLHTRHLKLLHIRGNASAFNPMRPGIHLLTLVAYTPHPVVLPKYC
jgi:hypothetical protein